jgi:hypothetical protein
MLCGSWPLRALWPEDEWLQARYGTNATTSGRAARSAVCGCGIWSTRRGAAYKAERNLINGWSGQLVEWSIGQVGNGWLGKSGRDSPRARR